MIRVALAEDIPALASAMKSKLALNRDINLKFMVENGQQMINRLEFDHNIDVILMDIKMPVMDGIEATKIINSRWPQIKIVMCTVFDDEDHIFQAILAGASGYMMKDESPANLFQAIDECLVGGAPMSPAIAKKSLDMLRRGAPQTQSFDAEQYNLSKREIEILEQLSRGLTYNLIADNLFISSGTVRKHIENVYRKLQVNNKVEALKVAAVAGLI
jgi:DNA-binding NarL/FixJ family response regulator